MKIKLRFHTVLPVDFAISTWKSQCHASFVQEFSSQIYIYTKKSSITFFQGTLETLIKCMCCIMTSDLGLLSSSKDVSCGFLSNNSLKSGLTGQVIFLSSKSIFHFYKAAILTSSPDPEDLFQLK